MINFWKDDCYFSPVNGISFSDANVINNIQSPYFSSSFEDNNISYNFHYIFSENNDLFDLFGDKPKNDGRKTQNKESFSKQDNIEIKITNENINLNDNANSENTNVSNQQRNDYSNSENDKDNKQKISVGRKRKLDAEKGNHTKYDEDDQMSKIKAYFMRFVIDTINSNLSHDHKKFLKINKKVSQNLRVKYNIDLMNTTLKEIIRDNSINGRYSKSEYTKDYNSKLIEEIYSKGEETKAIQILNMTYIEYFDVMRTKYLDKFKEDKIKKEKNLGQEDAENYVNLLVDLLFRYEQWFLDKSPKNNKKVKY